MEGEVHRREPRGEIIEKPSNWDAMVEKYTNLQNSRLDKVLHQYGTTEEAELPNFVAKAIAARVNRTEHRPIKDHAILPNPQNPEVLGLKQQLNAEIDEIRRRTLQASPSEPSEQADLKGRVSQKSQAPASADTN